MRWRCELTQAIVPRFSNRLMAAKYCKRIRASSDAATTVRAPIIQPERIRRHPVVNSGATTHKPALSAMSQMYSIGNQTRAKSFAPRTPYLRTNTVSEFSTFFIKDLMLFDYTPVTLI
jgi:hypothetical protein